MNSPQINGAARSSAFAFVTVLDNTTPVATVSDSRTFSSSDQEQWQGQAADDSSAVALNGSGATVPADSTGTQRARPHLRPIESAPLPSRPAQNGFKAEHSPELLAADELAEKHRFQPAALPAVAALSIAANLAPEQHLKAEPPNLADDGHGVRYTRAQLKATLAMMGCKTRHAHKVCLLANVRQVRANKHGSKDSSLSTWIRNKL